MKESLPFQHYFLSLFAVANNFSAIGMFVTVCSGFSKTEQRKLARIATITAFFTMFITLISGQAILNFFNISIDAFRIAGGMLLCTSGLSMLANKAKPTDDEIKQSFSKMIPTAIVPVAIPLTTGGGTISTIILLSSHLTHWAVTLKMLASIILMSIIIYLVFRYAMQLSTYLGNVGMDVVIKIMGLITLAIGVQFIIDGMLAVFPALS